MHRLKKIRKKFMENNILQRLEKTLNERQFANPAESYTAALFQKGEDSILKKLGEEMIETILASKEADRRHLIYETADLLFHLMVLLQFKKVTLAEVLDELARREGTSGIAEKNSRKGT